MILYSRRIPLRLRTGLESTALEAESGESIFRDQALILQIWTNEWLMTPKQ
ncbi:hypothetical protein DK66_2846 [Brucella suis 1330]|nr:hypothetical protein DK66_2846 [Brucella suis 1330]